MAGSVTELKDATGELGKAQAQAINAIIQEERSSGAAISNPVNEMEGMPVPAAGRAYPSPAQVLVLKHWLLHLPQLAIALAIDLQAPLSMVFFWAAAIRERAPKYLFQRRVPVTEIKNMIGTAIGVAMVTGFTAFILAMVLTLASEQLPAIKTAGAELQRLLGVPEANSTCVINKMAVLEEQRRAIEKERKRFFEVMAEQNLVFTQGKEIKDYIYLLVGTLYENPVARTGVIRSFCWASLDINGIDTRFGLAVMLTCAPARQGKGINVVIPNLLHSQGSVVVTDPKGELAAVTARQRAECFGQKLVE